MLILTPSHDIWLAILDAVSGNDRSQLKKCSLVCHYWHAYLRPQLMASIVFHASHYPGSYEDIEPLQRNKDLVRRLCIEHWDPSDWLSGNSNILSSTAVPAALVSSWIPFAALVTLELRDITFTTFESLRTCISRLASNGPALRNLIVFDCACADAYAIQSNLEEVDTDNNGWLAYQPHSLALVEVEINSDQDNYFASLLWSWLMLSPTLYAIRILDVRLDTLDEFDLHALFIFLSRPECLAEQLKLTMNTVCGPFRSSRLSSITSQTITQLSVTSQFEAASIAFIIATQSTLPSLRMLHVQVEADDEGGIGAENTVDRCNWQEHYPCLASVHLEITQWLADDDSVYTRRIQTSLMRQTVAKSQFMDYCMQSRILTVDAYDCTFDGIIENDGPDYHWTSEELVMK